MKKNSVQVLEMESLLADPDLCRGDLAGLLKAVQEQEKHKLRLVSPYFALIFILVN